MNCHVLEKNYDEESDINKMFRKAKKADLESYGVVFNSFYELEPVYADYYRKVVGRKAWHLGPVPLCNRDIDDKAQRGSEASINQNECLKWLDSKSPIQLSMYVLEVW